MFRPSFQARLMYLPVLSCSRYSGDPAPLYPPSPVPTLVPVHPPLAEMAVAAAARAGVAVRVAGAAAAAVAAWRGRARAEGGESEIGVLQVSRFALARARVI